MHTFGREDGGRFYIAKTFRRVHGKKYGPYYELRLDVARNRLTYLGEVPYVTVPVAQKYGIATNWQIRLNFAYLLREYRTRMGVSQRKLAELVMHPAYDEKDSVRISRELINRIENHRLRPPPKLSLIHQIVKPLPDFPPLRSYCWNVGHPGFQNLWRMMQEDPVPVMLWGLLRQGKELSEAITWIHDVTVTAWKHRLQEITTLLSDRNRRPHYVDEVRELQAEARAVTEYIANAELSLREFNST